MSIARTTGSHFKSVDAWFVDARKRIGWNALRKEHFSSKRVDIVDAATRFFLRPDENRTMDANIELKLAAIEKRAKDLYFHRFTESTLPLKPDVAVSDLTPAMKAQPKDSEQRRRERQQIMDSRSKQDALASSAYPSPAHSPGCTPEPFEISDDISIHVDASAGRKRGASLMDPDIDQDANSTDSKPRKRNRYAISLVIQRTLISYCRLSVTSPQPFTSLPSPAPSIHDSLEAVIDNSFLVSPLPEPPSIQPIISRKRRLSEADGHGAPKRPRNLPVGPRMQTVSDPLPISSILFEASSMDDWFQSNFGIPNSPQDDDLDPFFPLDVEVFDYSALGLDPQSSASTVLLPRLRDCELVVLCSVTPLIFLQLSRSNRMRPFTLSLSKFHLRMTS